MLKMILIASLIVFSGLAVLRLNAAEQKNEPKAARRAEAAGERFFEMRTYHANEGKMKALHARFRDHTNALFTKHGMDIVGYWVPIEHPNTLVYILAYPSKDAREKSWKAFQDDPAWKKAKAASEKDGVLVANVEQVFMTPTDYSPIK